jgi:hypothetical protein
MASFNRVLETVSSRHTREEHEAAIKGTLEYTLSKDQDSFLAIATMLCLLESKPATGGSRRVHHAFGGLSRNRAY